MHARVSVYENVDLGVIEEVQRWFESTTEDPFGDLPGYRGSMTLLDRDNARLVGIDFYAGAGQAREADALLGDGFAQAPPDVPDAVREAIAMRAESVGLYEIVHRD